MRVRAQKFRYRALPEDEGSVAYRSLVNVTIIGPVRICKGLDGMPGDINYKG